MERLAVFQHDVVRRVDHVIDGADAVAAETVGDPFRGRTDLHIFQKASAEAAAAAGLRDIDGASAFKRSTFFDDFHFWESDLPPTSCAMPIMLKQSARFAVSSNS